MGGGFTLGVRTRVSFWQGKCLGRCMALAGHIASVHEHMHLYSGSRTKQKLDRGLSRVTHALQGRSTS